MPHLSRLYETLSHLTLLDPRLHLDQQRHLMGSLVTHSQCFHQVQWKPIQCVGVFVKKASSAAHKHSHISKKTTRERDSSHRVRAVVLRLTREAKRTQLDIQSPVSIEAKVVEVDASSSFILGRKKHNKRRRSHVHINHVFKKITFLSSFLLVTTRHHVRVHPLSGLNKSH